MRLRTKIVLGILLEILLIWLWLHFIDVKTAVAYIKKININLICVGMFCYVSAYFIRSIRWKIILDPIVSVSVKKIFALYTAGMFVNYLFPPLRGGEFTKSIFLRKMHNIGITQTLPTVFVDKVIEASPVVFIFCGIVFSPYVPSLAKIIMLPMLISFLLFATLSIIAAKKKEMTSKRLKAIFRWLPRRFQHKLFEAIDSSFSGIVILEEHPIKLLGLVFLSLLAFLMDASYIFLFFKAFGVAIPFWVALVGYTLVTFSYIVPNPPCQVGSTEVIIILIFSGIFGINKNMVAAVDILAHTLTGLWIIFSGSFSLSMIGLKLKELVEIDEKMDDEYDGRL
ncbi:flippase-like domain-containing protein [Candidatus Desantisbacteria bacterium]|nr:flippase-like domain-containing protein [Candidatus Desantisbacteria bacterium]